MTGDVRTLAELAIKAKTVEQHLIDVNYQDDPDYVPSEFALELVNVMKLIDGGENENKTPVVHYRMIDKFIDPNNLDTINLCHRGLAKALSIDTPLPTPNGWVNMGDIKQGDVIFGEDGSRANVLAKSETFNKPMYLLTVSDGRTLKVSEDHINTVIHRRQKRVEGKRVNYLDRRDLTTKELLEIPLTATINKTTKNPKGKENKVWLPLPEPVQYPEAVLPIDPYTLGLAIGDGSMCRQTGFCRLHGHIDDLPEIMEHIPTKCGEILLDKRNPNNARTSLLGLGKTFKGLGLACHGNNKFVPKTYLTGSIEQRLSVLQGLMDTDGTVYKNGGMSFTSNSLQLVKDVQELIWSLGGMANIAPMQEAYRCSIQINMPVFRLQRKLERQKMCSFNRLPLVSIERIADQPSQCIMVDSTTKTFLAGKYLVTHNTTILEYLILYIAVFGDIPVFGRIVYALYVSDSVDNGVKKMRKALEYRYYNSAFLQSYIPEIKFTDIRWEFVRKDGSGLVVSGHGAKALSLDSVLYREHDATTIGECKVGDRIYGADGRLCTITQKSEVFHKPMYRLCLADGRSIKVSEDHINSVLVRGKHTYTRERINLTTNELLELPLTYTRDRGNRTTTENLVFVENCKPVEFPTASLPIDPYTLGVILGDGRIRKECGSVELSGHVGDFPTYMKEIPYEFGKYQIDKRNLSVRTQSIRGLGRDLVMMKLNVHGDFKFIPELYLRGSVEQRLALLQGLMDTDGTVGTQKINPTTSFSSNSLDLVQGVRELVYSLGGYCISGRTGDKAYRLQIHLNMPLFRLPRKLCRQKFSKKEYVAVTAIESIPVEPSQCIAVDNGERQFITEMFFRTHNTGVRGTRELGSRPVLALLDDLISDEDARSPTVIASVEDTVYKALDYALHPTRKKTIWNGTPFNAKDPIYKAVESGAWNVNVFPVCEKFPCTRAEFRGSWPDRFTYDYVKAQYEKSLLSGKLNAFNQELMLSIMSEDERVIEEADIRWYNQKQLIRSKGMFNFYITTDFAVSAKTHSDFSVISVWAINNNSDWFLVDGVCKRQLMDENIDDLFRLVQMYKPMSVGVEVSGQQAGFIPWINKEMMSRNIYFSFASSNNDRIPGMRPATNKLARFNVVLPWFKAGKIYLPSDMQHLKIVEEAVEELRLVHVGGFKSKHDDVIDTISMLADMPYVAPSGYDIPMKNNNGMWEMTDDHNNAGNSSLSSYIV